MGKKHRHPLVIKLKSGEYDGADIMATWLLIERLLGKLEKINDTIYAVGAPLGTDNYFKIRELAARSWET